MTAPSPQFTNLLTAVDSDFESGAGSWVAHTNATSVGITGVFAFSGVKALAWRATAAGNTNVSTGVYVPVVAGLPYVASCIINPAVARSCFIDIAYFNGLTFLGNSVGATVTVQPGGGPLTVSGVAPAGANLASVIVQVNGAAINELAQIDTVFLAQTDVQVLIDWANPPFAPSSVAGSSFYDITPFVRSDVGVSLAHGRQDAVSEVQPGSASFTAFNTNGWFTSQNSNSPWYGNVKLGRRVQINMADETGTWHVRFDGSVSELDYDYDPNGEAQVQFQGADVLAWLSRQDALSCWTREVVLADGPLVHYTLDDPAGSLTAAESSGNNGTPLRIKASGLGAAIAFASGSGGVEMQGDAAGSALGPFSTPLQSPAFTCTVNAAPTGWLPTGSSGLTAQFSPLAQGSSFSVECWFVLDSTAISRLTGGGGFNGQQALLSLADTSTSRNIPFSFVNDTPNAFLEGVEYANPPGGMGNPYAPLPVSGQTQLGVAVSTPVFPPAGVAAHFAVVFNGLNYTAYLNGASVGTGALATGGFSPNQIDVGQAYGGYGGWQGNITLASVYAYALSPAQVSAHAGMGRDGMYLASTSACISQLAAFAGLPAFWSNVAASVGIGKVDYIDITSLNALTAMQQFEAAELQGLIYVNAAGQLCFDGRQVRMGAGAPSLILPAGSYDPKMGQKVTDQYLVNKTALATAATSKTAFVVNQSSDNDYGDYSNGTPASPATLPLLAINPGFANLGVPASYGVQLDQVQDAAAWNVNRNDVPPFKATSIILDVLTNNNPATSEYVALSAVYGLEVNKVVSLGGAVTAMATDAGALDYFIEGISEVKSLSQHTIELYTSPANISRAWKPGDATYGVLDSTAVIGVSQTDDGHALPPHAKNASANPGMPYWPPVYGSTMNNGGLTGDGFVGARDQRGIYANLQIMMKPALCVVGQAQLSQSFASGVLQTLAWDTLFLDSAGAMGLLPDWPNWYVCLVPGYWELDATVVWSTSGVGAAVGRFCEFVVNKLGSFEGPMGPSANFVAGTKRRANTAQVPGITLSTRMYCGVGTTIGLRASQSTGSTISTSLQSGGSMMSIKFAGFNTVAG